MSSAVARAEARRKAILSRAGDRLAKLATSARGEEGQAYLHDDAPARGGAAFVGEAPTMPAPPPPPKDTRRPLPPPPPFGTPPDPSAWSPEQQRHLMQALMGSGPNPPPFAQSQPFSPQPAAGDPLTNIMAQLATMSPQGGAAPGKAAAPLAQRKAPTRFQKWLPLVHLALTWLLLAVFVLSKEPQAFVEKTAGAVDVAFWRRWPKLATQGTLDGVWGVQVVPFFWAFITLQVMLHSLRIFSGRDEIQPPVLLSVVLPHLPSQLSSLVMTGLRYVRMGSVFMDDIAAVVFGMGAIILITSWLV